MSAKLKIAFCTDGIFPHTLGGMQRHSRLLVEELARRSDVDLEVIHPHAERVFEGSPGVAELRVEPQDSERMYLPECYRYSRRVAALLAERPHHLVYAQGLSVWHRIAKLPNQIVVNPHGLEPWQGLTPKDKLMGFPFRTIFGHLFRHADRVVSLGGRLTGILQSCVPAGRVAVLPNAVNPPPPQTRAFAGTLRLLFVARFAHNKGIHLLLQAVRELHAEGHGSKFIFNLAGKGPLYETLTRKHQYPGVNYLGFVTDEQLGRLYAENDAFVFPTLFEGMPTVVLEAMGYSMPVIVSDTGATAELVGPDNGFLIPAGSVSALKQALLEFHVMPTAAKAGLAARSHAKVLERFTWPKVGQAHMDLFRSLHQEGRQLSQPSSTRRETEL